MTQPEDSLPRRSRGALVGIAALLISFVLIGVTSAVDWVGKPFAGFFVLGNGVVASVGLPSWPATRGGEIFQHRVVAVEGQPVGGSADLSGLIASRPEGSVLAYRLTKGGGEMVREVATRRFDAQDAALLFGAYLLNGLLLGSLGLYLIAQRGLDRGTRSAAPFLTVCALWGLSGMDLYGAHVLFRAHALCESLIFACAVQAALEFPTRVFGDRSTRRLIVAGYAVSALLAVSYQAVLFDPAGYVLAHLVATSLGGLGLLLVMLGLVVRYARRFHPAPWGALGVLAGGSALAFLGPVLLTLPEAVTGGTAPQNLVSWTVFVFPLALGYVVRRQECVVELRRPAA